MSSYGQYNLGGFGSGISCTADGTPRAKVAGVHMFWPGVKALTAARTFKDADSVEAGERYIRYGTIIARVTAGATVNGISPIGRFVPLIGTGAAGAYTGYNGDATMAVSVAEGDLFLVNRSKHEDEAFSDHVEALDGGRMYIRRLLVAGYGDGTGGYPDAATDAADVTALFAGATIPTAAQFKAALPQIFFVTEGNPAPVSA
jgi:hypothetical protein